MRTNITVDKASLRALQRNLGNIASAVKAKAIRQGSYKLVQQVARGAKSRAPVGETGLLKKSIVAKTTGIRKGRFRAWAGINVNTTGVDKEGKPRQPVKYAHLVHDGFLHANGTHIKGRPFMRDSVNSTPNNGLDIIAREAAAAAKRYSKK